jgi:DNA invertase Pin-like site-specific DNA recombinase/DNA-binding XRE family transcriptional regulator
MNPNDIAAHHRSRLALIYIRQSSPHQVLHHRESQLRQRCFQQRAADLGWPTERIRVIDEDLGQSATNRHQDRTGFQNMMAEAAIGHVGIILALELSRLSRSNQDWYHLLDICAVTGTLLADEEGLYDPRAYNDRLLLGLKGTMSEAEIHIMKQRLVEAMRSKAKRGEFCFRLPPGYEWDEAGRMVKTPDEQVRSAIELMFARFEQWGTIHRVQSSMAEDGLQVPIVSGPGQRLRWGRPDYAHLRRILTHPIYAGAYCYGRRQVEQFLDSDQRPMKRIREQRRQQWHVLIRDHHEAYLSWERFERIQSQIQSNRRNPSGPGAPREGRSLLQGLILCGQCGRRMRVLYNSRSAQIRYCCVRPQAGLPVCQDFGGRRLERGVEELVLEALQPVGMEAMIEAAADHTRACEAERAHWRQRVERARYEVDLARRQYEAVDPANRLVGRELERRFDKALHELEDIELKTQTQMETMNRPLTEEEQQTLNSYAEQLPQLWHAPTTQAQERKRIVRCLIETVIVTAPKDAPHIKAEVHWIGGQTTTIEVRRGRKGVNRYVADPELVELIRQMAAEFSDAQMARILNRKGLRTAKGLVFTAYRVSNLRHSYDIESGTAGQKRRSEDIYTAEEAAGLLGVNRITVTRWVEVGLLRGSQMTPGAPWRVRVTEEDRRRLSVADSADGWLPLKGAAQMLGVSQQTVLQKIKDRELQAVRVRVRRRSAWRILVPATPDQQPLLFDSSNS